MYLSKIELFGFKSFAHKVRIAFDKGLTAIVGPNGCGKTNVVDAIRWVLGEQRTSLLRSTKMENIIFNGSKNLKPLSLTEVSLTIENTRNVLPVEYTEVTVTRRLYRNGDSDYLLNQVPCRLKDILDLFTDTGMGSDAYSVIELKMIEEIISNKSEERLKLFEEAAGITRYKQRRKQTFKQLESASRDLSRVDDVVAEVEKKVRSLKLQVKKAEKLRELKVDIQRLDLRLAGITLQEQLEKLGPLKKRIEQEDALCHELAALIAMNDSRLQEAELLQLRREEELSVVQKRINEGSSTIHELEKKLLQLEEKRKSLEASSGSNRLSLQEKKEKIHSIERRIKELDERKIPLEAICNTRLEEYSNLSSEHDRLNTELQKQRHAISEKRNEIADKEKAIGRLVLARQSLENRSEHLRSSLQRAEASKSFAKSQIEDQKILRKNIEAEIALQKSNITAAREEGARLKKEMESISDTIETQRETMLSMKTERNKIDNRIALFNAVLDNFEGLPEGIAFLEKHKANKTDPGCLSDLIALDPAYRKAVHAALGEALSYYVCRSSEEARQALELLHQSKKGKLHFLVLDLVKTPETAQKEASEGVSRLLELLKYPDELAPSMELLLGNCYLVDNLEKGKKLSQNYTEAVFVTPEGEKFDAKGIIYGGSPHGSEVLRLGKKAERDLMLKQQAEMNNSIAKAESVLTGLRIRFESIAAEKKQLQTEPLVYALTQLEKKLALAEAEEKSRREQLRQAEIEIAEFASRQEELKRETETLDPEILQHEQQLLLVQQSVHNAQESISTLELRHHNLSREVQKKQSLHRDAVLELEKLVFSINGSRQTLNAVHEDIRKLEQSASDTKKRIGETVRTIAELKNELELHLITAAGEQASQRELETICRELQASNHEARNAQREQRRKHDISRELVSELENERVRSEQLLDHLLTSIRVRYSCDLDAVEPAELPEGFNREEAEKRLEALQNQREQFGAVNELALEEYETEKERLEFLLAQKSDLLSAESQLRTTIDEINKTALQKFRDTYTAVRKNFITIFHELFDPEDEVDLLISSSDDPLEAHIEIIAKPRGKKPLSIEQLSGGEKALTALSLLFAIYLVKPSPFCILDEVDAPLDDANVGRFIKLLKKFENNTQFIIVTHNKKSMASCQALYGVTMEEEGVSKLIPVRLEKQGL
ncbi:MAG: chromosome segregation protein SMC [Chlorobium sp.]|uniref:chromosome segregation protein SMC n=1 Tax=Chlorobium sp. TaxID=1095 RepID=UPI0025C1AB78|nr:chromosome segregation protein SMC [Chlorobium sp.]MCF8216470.1 chromosome segregation protein SMC [Chlorobium sp.]MCF8271364.1 chromosome segregation protein SMC [Chlorobium sp.]MCF8287747.1 chromosome segregation protein SMC [Chlorobium sp.]MCF8291275.1 chromosome segregation protein SMC [Chlorobium sp.]MCF8385370.1 chromosome segregation protein SMC [Chlorobium sp.]